METLSLCYGQRAVKVSDTRSCSARRRPLVSRFVKSTSQSPAVLNTVSCVYESELVLSEMKKVLITVTWTRNLARKGIDLEFLNPRSPIEAECKYEVRRPRGCDSIEFHDSKIELCWNLSEAEYDNGCEPTRNFHLTIYIDSELCLKLGDSESVETSPKVAKTAYFNRRESFTGNTFYSTKAKFCDDGKQHDIEIKCLKETEKSGAEGANLQVLVDSRKTVHVGNLHWNFRGSQTIFVDGLVVDMMWDVRGWFSRKDQAVVFLFRTRTGTDSRLWFEEKNLFGDHLEFSLVICGSGKKLVE